MICAGIFALIESDEINTRVVAKPMYLARSYGCRREVAAATLGQAAAKRALNDADSQCAVQTVCRQEHAYSEHYLL